MFIVFADVEMADASEVGARSDIGRILAAPFNSSPSVFVGSRPPSSSVGSNSRPSRPSARAGHEVHPPNAYDFGLPEFLALIIGREILLVVLEEQTSAGMCKLIDMMRLFSQVNYRRRKASSEEIPNGEISEMTH